LGPGACEQRHPREEDSHVVRSDGGPVLHGAFVVLFFLA
jgi:hypothetical protein